MAPSPLQPCRVCKTHLAAVMAIHTSGANSIVRETRSPSPTGKATKFSSMYLQVHTRRKTLLALLQQRQANAASNREIGPGSGCPVRLQTSGQPSRASKSKSRVHVSRNFTQRHDIGFLLSLTITNHLSAVKSRLFGNVFLRCNRTKTDVKGLRARIFGVASISPPCLNIVRPARPLRLWNIQSREHGTRKRIIGFRGGLSGPIDSAKALVFRNFSIPKTAGCKANVYKDQVSDREHACGIVCLNKSATCVAQKVPS